MTGDVSVRIRALLLHASLCHQMHQLFVHMYKLVEARINI
jgi:hypothetical protein